MLARPSGGAVYASGGQVVDCIFDGCGATAHNTSSTGSGNVLYLFGPSAAATECGVAGRNAVARS